MRAARRGDLKSAARCELALLGIGDPTPAQLAGAVLRAHHADDVRRILYAMTETEE